MTKRASDTNIGSTTNTDKAIQNELQTNIQERTTQINILGDPGKQLQEASFISGLSNKKRKVDSILKGTALSNYYPFPNGDILNSFRTQNTSPETPEALPNTRLAANEKHVSNRIIKPISETLDPIGKYELGIMHRANDYNLNTMYINAEMFQMNSLKVLTPATFNYILFMLQYEEFKKNKEEYYKRSPEDYWDEWSLEGIVEFEEMANGAESYVTSGYNGKVPYQQAGGNKLCTVVSKGPQFVFNYWGDDIEAGKDAYFVLKKHDIPSEYYYMLNNKNNMASLSGVRKLTPEQTMNKELFKPFQLAAFTLPGHLPVPREYKQYYDENGLIRRDGLIIKAGTFFSVPVGMTYKINNNFNPKPITIQNKNTKIFNDSHKGARKEETMLAKLILNCSDGIFDY